MAVVEDEIEPADPEPGLEEPLLPAGVPAGEPRGSAEGEPGEDSGERGLEDHGLRLGEAADDVDGEDRRQEVEALIAPRADGVHLPLPLGHRRAAAAPVAPAKVVPRVASAERGVDGEHVRRRAGRHGRALAEPRREKGDRQLRLTKGSFAYSA